MEKGVANSEGSEATIEQGWVEKGLGEPWSLPFPGLGLLAKRSVPVLSRGSGWSPELLFRTEIVSVILFSKFVFFCCSVVIKVVITIARNNDTC